jgi:hypothetical protein
MSTRCTIGYEMPDGTYRATYVHYEGYPAHMKVLLRFSTDEIKLFVTNGWLRGGIRSIDADSVEYFNDPGWEEAMIETEWPPNRKYPYAYMLRLNGEWVCVGEYFERERKLSEVK